MITVALPALLAVWQKNEKITWRLGFDALVEANQKAKKEHRPSHEIVKAAKNHTMNYLVADSKRRAKSQA